MNNTIYILRHAHTEIDSNIPPDKWGLSEKGKKRARNLAKKNTFDKVDVVISSGEKKAYQTALPIAQKLNKKIIQASEINELNRPKFLGEKELNKTLKFAFTNPDKSINEWETANHALNRFDKAIKSIDRKHKNKKILIVSHGCVINLYFAKMLGCQDKTHERMMKNDFCSYGIIKNGKVIKDIN